MHALITALNPTLRRWRHDMHHMPELSMAEHQTAAYIAKELSAFGIELETGIGGTGMVARIPGKGEGRTIGLRAEIDALPMEDASGKPYASQFPGRSHACGHDGHAASLMGAAAILAQHRPHSGTVNIYFQPGEETGAGATSMLRDGLWEKYPCEEIYSMHNMPLIGKGNALILNGPTLTGYIVWTIDIQGVGGHGAAAHKTKDPLQLAARLATEISSFAGRYVDPMEPALITVTKLNAGSSHNIIPDTASLGGTLRGLSREMQDMLFDQLEKACKGFAEMTGCTVSCKKIATVAPCINAADCAAAVADACGDVLGTDHVITDHKPLPFTDDFAFLLEKCKGAYFFLGQDGPMCHNPAFDFDDDTLPRAAEILCKIAITRTAL